MSFTDTRQASTFRAPQTLQARQLPAGVLLEVMAILFEHRETSESILSLWEELGKPKHEGRLEYYIPLLPALWRAVPYDDHWRWLDRYKLLQAAKRLIEIRLPDWNACTSLSTGGRKQDSKFRSHSPENSAILSKVEGLELDDPTAKWISMNDRTNRKHQWLEDVISKDGALRLLYGQVRHKSFLIDYAGVQGDLLGGCRRRSSRISQTTGRSLSSWIMAPRIWWDQMFMIETAWFLQSGGCYCLGVGSRARTRGISTSSSKRTRNPLGDRKRHQPKPKAPAA